MNDPQTAAAQVQQAFEKIWHEQMAGIDILNPRLSVQTLGFQPYRNRVIGLVITPWLMALIMLPGEDDDWTELELGKKKPHRFPSGTRKFMVNEFDGIGVCQTHSLYSPMHEFESQDHALAAAQGVLDTLMVEGDPSMEEPAAHEPPACTRRGEATAEVRLEDFATIEPTQPVAPTACASPGGTQSNKTLSRRDLLRGSFLRQG